MGKRRNFRKLNGILLLDKSVGISSNKALQETRFLFQAAKAGHTGSLDPLASGMLPICFGEATKVSAFLLDADKRYLTTASLGRTSTTGDSEGDLSPEQPVPAYSTEYLQKVLGSFRGEIQQIPPMYSALKQNGQPLYKLAREGKEVDRKPRQVRIQDLILHNHDNATLSLEVRCSKGTYIRTLVEDIGAALGCGAYVSMLRRLEVNPFEQLPMYPLPELKEHQGQLDVLDEYLLPIDSALPHLDKLNLPDLAISKLKQGQKLSRRQYCNDDEAEGLRRVYDEAGHFLGLIEINGAAIKVKRLLAC